MKRVILISAAISISLLSIAILTLAHAFPEYAMLQLLRKTYSIASSKDHSEPLAFILSGGRVEALPLWAQNALILLAGTSAWMAGYWIRHPGSSIRSALSRNYLRKFSLY